ncbi:MAG: KTSC domain-containing protein [Methylacidiphilales bacterium]|nr:KTSC domain-containing protein [Candidatus Methylacidiphilales bacterium]NJR18025.1 KTSC domain-containing protein [Calothrix sp. CSU_2_0]
MKLSRLSLGSVIAVAHVDNHLQLLLSRGDELELLETPAPVAAFEGLQQLNEIVAEADSLPDSSSHLRAIAMLPVNSSMANAIGYEESDKRSLMPKAYRTLQVEFRNGATYQYAGVEPEIWQELHETSSIGRYFNNQIRGNYDSSCIDEDDYYS